MTYYDYCRHCGREIGQEQRKARRCADCMARDEQKRKEWDEAMRKLEAGVKR